MSILKVIIIVAAVLLIFQLAFKVGFIVLVLGVGIWIGYQYKNNKFKFKKSR